MVRYVVVLFLVFAGCSGEPAPTASPGFTATVTEEDVASVSPTRSAGAVMRTPSATPSPVAVNPGPTLLRGEDALHDAYEAMERLAGYPISVYSVHTDRDLDRAAFEALSEGIDEGLLPDGQSWIGLPEDAYTWMNAIAVYVDSGTGNVYALTLRSPDAEWAAGVPVGFPVIARLQRVALDDGRALWLPGYFEFHYPGEDYAAPESPSPDPSLPALSVDTDLVGIFALGPGTGSGWDVDGCPMLISGGQRYLVQYPERWTIRDGSNGIELVGPDGSLHAQEGDLVGVDGMVDGEGHFSCTGLVFRARKVVTTSPAPFRSYELSCGPMPRDECVEWESGILTVAARQYPGETISSIRITGRDGDYEARLTNGHLFSAEVN